MLKFEIDEYNPSVLRHLSVALLAIAVDYEASSTRPPTKADMLAGVGPALLVVPPPLQEGDDLQKLSGELLKLQAETATTATLVVPPPPPESAADQDADFPDPPGASNLDVNGIPWDARIHAATRTKCKDGTWKNKPGVDPALLASVTAELKGVQAIPVPPAPVATTSGPTTFAELIKELTPLLTGGKLTAQQVNEQCQTHGLPNCNALAGRIDLIPAVWSQICLIAG